MQHHRGSITSSATPRPTALLAASLLMLLVAGCGRTTAWKVGGDKPGREICNNNVDDDKDGLTDCADLDCQDDPHCDPTRREICDNGRDDDGDGAVDCADADCKRHPRCQTRREICDNHRDDDDDGAVDCFDVDCFGDPSCRTMNENCQNGIDDDGDGAVDCQDSDCFAHPACRVNKENCTNNIDDDRDTLVDCKDPDCKGHPACGPGRENCINGTDDDGDKKIDCDDSDCKGHPACWVNKENCTNNVDDDRDGFIDCKDPDCFKHPACKKPGQEICNNNLDDDHDGAIDCKDSDCARLPICRPGKEDCSNKRDDDGDGAVDCDDPDCKTFPACQSLLCKPTVEFGTVMASGSSVTRTMNTKGTIDRYASACGVPGGGEVIGHFRLDRKADVKLSYVQLSGDHVISVFRAGVGETCNANSKGCFDPESKKSGSFSLKALDAGDYYLFAEAFAKGLEGALRVTISTGRPQAKENCTNGVDDDGDGATDCADLDCTFASSCVNQNCKYDNNLGSLILDGPAKRVYLNTKGAGDDVAATCAAGGGHDRVVRLVMPAAGGIAVKVSQNGWHTLGLHRDKGPGTTCMADKGSCFDTNKTPAFQIVYQAVEKGVYYYVVDALKAGTEGTIRLTFRAFSNRGPELCANGVDDDGDGLIDCKDPDCTGVVGCPGPVCTADFNAGTLAPGSLPVRVSANTTTANNDQTVSCAQGGGKDVVVALKLSQVAGLRIRCSQTGDHVLGLFAAGAPRDPCDKIPANCADLKTGPLGCNFIFPNLQPGDYYLVVEAFKPGKEGTVSLNLSAVPDHAQEICNNKKDDDGDGKIDCQDSNCSTKPICQGKTCTPDKKIGLLATGGGKKNVAVTTSGAGDKNSAGCALGGGEDAAVSFRISQRSNVEISFAQFGNHVFALYQNRGSGFACDAAPIGCQTSKNQSAGKIVFSNVGAGEYYLVVEAVAAGGEGSVVMQLQAK